MKNIIVALVLGVASFGAAACTSSSSPVSPSADARLSSTAAGTPATDAKPDYAAAAKPGALTIVGIVLQADDEFDVLQAAVVRAGLVDALLPCPRPGFLPPTSRPPTASSTSSTAS